MYYVKLSEAIEYLKKVEAMYGGDTPLVFESDSEEIVIRDIVVDELSDENKQLFSKDNITHGVVLEY